MRLKKDLHILLTKMSPNKLKVFISGSTGFIGKHLKRTLKNDYLLITPNRKKLNLNNINQVKKYLKIYKPNIILHLASSTKFKINNLEEKKNQIKNTFNITKNLVKSFNPECKLLVFFGSIEEYGKSKVPFKENQTPKPITYYGKYKYKSFQYVSKHLKKKNMNYLWLRPSLTYGKGDNIERFLGYVINSIIKKKKITINSGNKIRDYIYIEDLCKVIMLIIKNYKKEYKCILNISAQNYIKIKSIKCFIEKIINKKLNYEFVTSKKKQTNLYSSNKKLLKFFPKLKFMSFKNGLFKTLKENMIL